MDGSSDTENTNTSLWLMDSRRSCGSLVSTRPHFASAPQTSAQLTFFLHHQSWKVGNINTESLRSFQPLTEPTAGAGGYRSSIDMISLTMIARVADGLPLAASIQEDEQYGRDLQPYQNQAKQLFRRLNTQSPDRCTLEAGSMNFHYVIAQGVCYLCLCEASFPKKLAFAYLEDLHSEFHAKYGKKVPTMTRPYSFIEFDTYIQKTQRSYVDRRAKRNLGSINNELQDVQRIMVANIEEVLQRGEALSALDTKAVNLSNMSKKYRSDAKYLNTRSTYAKVAAVSVFFLTLIIYVRFWWL